MGAASGGRYSSVSPRAAPTVSFQMPLQPGNEASHFAAHSGKTAETEISATLVPDGLWKSGASTDRSRLVWAIAIWALRQRRNQRHRLCRAIWVRSRAAIPAPGPVILTRTVPGGPLSSKWVSLKPIRAIQPPEAGLHFTIWITSLENLAAEGSQGICALPPENWVL